MPVFEGMHERPSRAGHFESRAHAFKVAHVETTRAVVRAFPTSETKRAAARTVRPFETLGALRAEDDVEPSAPRAAQRVEQVHKPVNAPSNHAPECSGRDGSRAGYNGSVEVSVLLFASIAEKAGTRRVSVTVPEVATVGRVRDAVLERFPQIAESLPTLLYALNEEYVKEWQPVPPGSTLALIPPVSGG